MSRRVIVYGDIHGCLDEFKALRSKIKPNKDDIEISVGDFLNKGPYSIKTLRYIEKKDILSVMGNNEAKIIKLYHKHKNQDKKTLEKLRKNERETITNLKKSDLTYLESLPYFIKIANLTIVHGGIKKGVVLDNEMSDYDKKQLTLLRFYNKDYESIPYGDKDNRFVFWSEVYKGEEGFVVFGHHPFDEVKVQEYAVGIDTGCIYGGKLTAIIFEYDGKTVDTKNYKIVEQKAFKNYFE
jgi:bis(5'-nucleosyl)-tetraphosphatase (symmetrical)